MTLPVAEADPMVVADTAPKTMPVRAGRLNVLLASGAALMATFTGAACAEGDDQAPDVATEVSSADRAASPSSTEAIEPAVASHLSAAGLADQIGCNGYEVMFTPDSLQQEIDAAQGADTSFGEALLDSNFAEIGRCQMDGGKILVVLQIFPESVPGETLELIGGDPPVEVRGDQDPWTAQAYDIAGTGGAQEAASSIAERADGSVTGDYTPETPAEDDLIYIVGGESTTLEYGRRYCILSDQGTPSGQVAEALPDPVDEGILSLQATGETCEP